MTTPATLLARLQTETAWLRRRRWLVLGLAGLAGVAAPALALGLLDLAVGFREATAGALVLALLALALAGGGAVAWRRRHRQPTVAAVALRLEADQPQLMDAVICAVELVQRGEPPANSLQHALLKQAADHLAAVDVHAAATRREWPAAVLAGLLAAVLGALVAVSLLPFGVKARHGALERLGLAAPALTVAPGDVELAAASDLRVEARLTRAAGGDVEIVVADGRGRHTYPMSVVADGHYRFDLFGIDADLGYRVRTPTLASRRYQVRVFSPPRVTAAELTVTPPAYTRQPVQHQAQLTDLTIPAGSTVRLRLDTAGAATARLVAPAAKLDLPLAANGTGRRHEVAWQPATDLDYAVTLTDRAGHAGTAGPPHRLNVVPDTPPTVRILTPEAETSTHPPDARVLVLAQASDDYGLRRVTLRFNVSGRGWEAVELFADTSPTPPRERDGRQTLDLKDRVHYGDIVAFYVEALDNAEPQAQHGRSEVRFLEIRPPKPEPKESQGGGSGTSLSVADLIVEQKRILRQTLGLEPRPGQERDEALAELVKAETELRSTTTERFAKVREAAAAAQLSLGPMGALFAGAETAMKQAEVLLQQGLPADALAPQQTALSQLVQIDIELSKNTMKGKGQGKGQGEGQSQNEASANDAKAGDRQAAELRDQLERLGELVKRQRHVNEQLDSAARDGGLTPATAAALAAREDELAGDAEAVRQALARSGPETGAAGQEVGHGTEQLRLAGRALGGASPAAAARTPGQRAAQHLERARDLLQQLQRDLTGNRLATAAAQLEALRQRQEALRQQTETLAAGDPAAARAAARGAAGDQGQLQTDFQRALAGLERATEELQHDRPEAAQAVAAALAGAAAGRIGESMKRAENALRYGLLSRAGDSQRQAAAGLAQLAKQLAAARDTLPGLSPEALGELLERTLEQYRQLQRAEKGELAAAEQRQLAEQIRHDLAEMARQLGDPRLQQLAGEVQGLGAGAGDAILDPGFKTLVARAAQLLERRLWEDAMGRKLRLSRSGGNQAPDEYRKLVEQYFKNLSDVVP